MAGRRAESSDAAALRLTWALAALIAVQAVWGRAAPGLYRDGPQIALTWVGNDWINLALGLPILLAAGVATARGGARARLIWIGALAFAVYNYAFYLLGAALNAAFLLYVVLVLVSATALARALLATDAGLYAARLRPGLLPRLAAGYLGAVALGLTLVWVMLWARIHFGASMGGLGPEAFQVVAALDMTLLVAPLTLGAWLMLGRHPWGAVIAPAVAVQGAMYLAVLSTNAVVGVASGMVPPPGEVPVWGTLAPLTALSALVLLGALRPEPPRA